MDDLGTILRDALHLVERESPLHVEAVVKLFGGVSLRVEVPPESLLIQVAGSRMAVHDWTTERGSVVVKTTLASVLEVVDGRCLVADAIADRRLMVQGSSIDLEKAALAVHRAIHGLVRCRRGPHILYRLHALKERREAYVR